MSVVITGIGVKSPLGCTVREAMENIGKGTRCVADIENLDTKGFSQTAAGEIRSNGKVVKTEPWTDRKAKFLEEAISDLFTESTQTSGYTPEDIALNIGSGVDYVDVETLYKKRQFENPPGEEVPAHYKSVELINQIAAKYNIKGGVNIFYGCMCCLFTSHRHILQNDKKGIPQSSHNRRFGFHDQLCQLHWVPTFGSNGIRVRSPLCLQAL